MPDRQNDLMQIGDVAARTGLSLRTVRYYEEAGLVEPCDRSVGGFRLYSETECERLELLKQLKPMGFSIDQMKEIVPLLDQAGKTEDLSGADYQKLLHFLESVDTHCVRLEEQLQRARQFGDELRVRAGVEFSRHGEADDC